MPSFDVRIDVCFTYDDIEADTEEEAIEIAEAQLDEDMEGGRIVETIAFAKDDDDDD